MGLLWWNRSKRSPNASTEWLHQKSQWRHSGAFIMATLGNGCADRNLHQNGFLDACFFHDWLLIPRLTSMHLAVEPGSHAYTLAPKASGKVKASFYAGKVQTHEVGNPLHGGVPPKAKTARKNDTFSLFPRIHNNEQVINQNTERQRVFRVGRLMFMTSPSSHSNSA